MDSQQAMSVLAVGLIAFIAGGIIVRIGVLLDKTRPTVALAVTLLVLSISVAIGIRHRSNATGYW